MVAIPRETPHCPTLSLAEKKIEEMHHAMPRRDYLGMSSIGDACERKTWYSYHDPIKEKFNAATIMRFEDGHRSEALLAERLKATPGIELHTHDEDGNQFAFEDFDGKFRGHADGYILGLVQAPKTWHIWEAKCTNLKKFANFKQLKADIGEKQTLKQWDSVYYAQAQAYMGYSGLNRHYLTVCIPGGRDWESVRTEFNREDFEAIQDKAKRILDAKVPLARLSNDPNWFQCKWCAYKEKCHVGTQKISV